MEIGEKQKRKLMVAAEVVEKGDFAVLEKILEFQDFLEQNDVKLSEFFAKIEADILAYKENINNELSMGVTPISELVTELKGECEEMEDKMGKTHEKMMSEVQSIKSKMTNLVSEIQKVRSEIPEMPAETDLTDIYNRLVEIESKLPTIPEEISGEQIVEKINKLPIDEEKLLIGIEHINGLENRLVKIEKSKQHNNVVGVSGRDFIYSQDIGSQFDGVTKTFNISGVYMIVAVMLDSFPYGALVENVHYTYTNTTITFTDEITADAQLSSGQRCKLICIRV